MRATAKGKYLVLMGWKEEKEDQRREGQTRERESERRGRRACSLET